MPCRPSRRSFLRMAASGAAAASWIGVPAFARSRSPGEKLNLAVIGVGGRGHANLMAVGGENVVALCDVDENHLGAAARKFPAARKYVDFRKLLQTEKELDAAVVSTPDHCHAAVSVMAMKMGLHVYCEKPLTHSVHEARVMTETVLAKKLVTQMGTGAQSAEDHIRTVEAIRSGVIGPVHEAHCWTNRPIWPQGQTLPPGEDPVPKHLHWDEWIGPAPMRPFKNTYPDGPFQGKQVYHPFVWRGWWDFGTGALGDIAPHIMNIVFWALELGAPTGVEAESSTGIQSGAFPAWSKIRFDFPGRDQQPAVSLFWYDGGQKPPAALLDGQTVGENGTLFVGSKGRMMVGGLPLPRKDFADFKWPEPTLPRRGEIHLDWIRSIKEGGQTGCRFEYSGPMTEAYLLGNIALRVGRKIAWDPAKMEVPGDAEANGLLRRDYRSGYEL